MKKKRYEYLSLDLTPLIDVVFILLIFFIVTSSFKKDKFVLNLELPQSSSIEKFVDKKQLTLELDNKYLVYMGEKITIERLKSKLALIKDKKQAIIINIDKTVLYKNVIKILDILQSNHLNNIGFVTKSNTKKD
jgi:biopolymer transport protein ExbD